MAQRWIGKSTGERADVISGFGLDIPPKAIVAILGPSGCGKTTLLRALGMESPADHPGLKSSSVLDVTGECNGKRIRSINSTRAYVRKHFELLDEPLRGKRAAAVRTFIDELNLPDEKKDRGVLFGTHYMSPRLLEAVDKVLIMDDPPLYGVPHEERILERLQVYFNSVGEDGRPAQEPYVDPSPEKEAAAHERSLELLFDRYAGAVEKKAISQDAIRRIYEAQVRSFNDYAKYRLYLPSLSYAKAKGLIAQGLQRTR